MVRMTPEEELRQLELEELRHEEEILSRRLAASSLVHFTARFTSDFIPGWHIDRISEACEWVERTIKRNADRIKNGHSQDLDTSARLILEAPPRHGKSQTTSRCLPLWYLARHPSHEVIVATYSGELASDLGRWAKQMVDDPAFKAVFPDFEIRKDSKAADRLQTKQGGGIRYVGVGGSLTGRGGHLIIVDDPVKDAEAADSQTQSDSLWAWWTSVLRTRLAPGGGIVVMHTRWRTNDLIGRLLDAQDRGGEKWVRKTFKALAEENDEWDRQPGQCLHPARMTQQEMELMRDNLLATNPRDWWSLYQQSPVIEGGNVFKDDDFHFYKPGTIKGPVHWYITSDLAVSQKTSADFSMIWPFCIDAEGHIWFAPDFVYGRMTIDVLVKEILKVAYKYKALGIIIEGGVIFNAIAPLLRMEMRRTGRFVQLHDPQPTKDKYARSRPIHTQMSMGYVHYPDTVLMRGKVMQEFLRFTGKDDEHDDCVDAAAWAGIHAEKAVRPHGEQTEESRRQQEEAEEPYWMRSQPRQRERNRHRPTTFQGEERQTRRRFGS